MGRYGVADDFPNEVEEIRKALYPLLKKAKQDKKKAFFNNEKLVIDNAVYHGPESKKFPLSSIMAKYYGKPRHFQSSYDGRKLR